MATITVGVLALQGGVVEHLSLLRKAAASLFPGSSASNGKAKNEGSDFGFIEVRTAEQLAQCDALVIPGGESTTMAIVAKRLGLLDPLRQFVKYVKKTKKFFFSGFVFLSPAENITTTNNQWLQGRPQTCLGHLRWSSHAR
jgi:pyridoxal 5'-phosphate synthase pdxT subunit